MKLVELLARELKVWPEDDECADVAAIVQDPSKNAYVRLADDSDDFELSDGEWIGVWHNDVTSNVFSELASDYRTAIVTRADWEAEVARLAQSEQSPRERIKELHALAIAAGMGVRVENPLTWRDRIREIDITVEALEEERAGLVQQLEDEGFRLINQEVKPSTKPRSEWAVGDLVVRVEKTDESSMPIHIPMPITYFDGTNRGQDVCVDGEFYPMVSTLRWHSRPSA